MDTEIISQPPHTRCYICHKADVEKICHHCGRAICSHDRSTNIPEEAGVENPEFTGLDLDQVYTDKDIIHCEDCMHYVRSYKWMQSRAIKLGGGGLAAVVIGFIFGLWWAILLGFLAIVAGVFWYRWINQKHDEEYEQARLESCPPFPVIPVIRSVTISENSEGRINLDSEGKYSSHVSQSKGKLSITLQFSQRDRERLEVYLEKYKLPLNDGVPFHAGFTVLDNAPNLQFDVPTTFMEKRPNTIALTGTIGEQPFLSNDEALRDSNWTSRFTYVVLEGKGKQMGLPVQIIPTLVQDGSQRAIELVVQISPNSLSNFDTMRIEEFVLNVPHRLSKIAMLQPSAVTGFVQDEENGNESVQSIIWKGLDVDSGTRRERRQRFYLRFENKVESDTIFWGSLRVCFAGTLSGFDSAKFFYPWGKKRSESVLIQKQTYLDVGFELDLSGLRFQETTTETARLLREGVVPSHAIVTQLAEDINDTGVYVKRVIENPARTNKAGAHITNRYWDMAGRYYEGVYPIDFHLVLTGEETYSQLSKSKVQVDVTVQGIVTNDEMRDKVLRLRDQLVAIIENTLDCLPEAPDTLMSEPTEHFIMPDVEDDIPSASPEPFRSVPSGPVPDSITHLLQMLNKLDEALLEGRISEDRYDEMQTRYKDQLTKLGYSF